MASVKTAIGKLRLPGSCKKVVLLLSEIAQKAYFLANGDIEISQT